MPRKINMYTIRYICVVRIVSCDTKPIIHFYNLDASRMDQMADFPDRGFDINDQTADFNSASGTARAGTQQNISMTKIFFENVGHRLKSAVAYPVVVISDATLKCCQIQVMQQFTCIMC